MADVVIQAVIQKAVDIASNLIIQEGSRLSKVKDDINWIEMEMRYIQSYLEDADVKQGENSAVATLVSDIRRLGLDVEDIMDTYFPKIASPKRKGFSGCLSASSIFSYIHSAHNFAAEIEGIRTRVLDINRRRTTYGIQERSSSINEGISWDARRSFPHLDEPNVVGFEEHINILVARMLDGDSQCGVVSITGMAGLGKTTLVKKVYNAVRQSFECSAWICVSQQPNIVELLQDIARQVGLEKEKWKHNVEHNLFEFLRHKRYAIVIDDIWKPQVWDTLQRGIPNNFENGARIILTSRNKDVGIHVGGQNSLHELQPLDPENSRNLFFKIIGGPLKNMKEHSDPSELEIISEKILKRCGGVPLAIVLTAEDYEIIASNLINIWASEGFVQGSRVREVEEVGEDYLNHLVSRNLIQVARRNFFGKIKSLRIHDILHSLCVRVAEEINFFSIHSEVASGNPSSSSMRVRRLIAYHPTRYLGKAYQSELKRKIITNFPEDWRFVRVLSIEADELPNSLPSEIGNLSHLIYIRLKTRRLWTKLPSTISNLKSLLILDVWGCEIPNCIWKMKQLRHIMLHVWSKIKFCFGGQLGKLLHSIEFEAASLNLETLYGLRVQRSLVKYWFPKFTNLKKLGVVCYENEGWSNVKELLDVITVPHKLEVLHLAVDLIVDLNLSRFENLFRLHLEGTSGEFLEHDSTILPPNLSKLTLRENELSTDPMETLKKLPKLKILKLEPWSYIGEKMLVCSGGEGTHNFPQLQVSEIVGLYNLLQIVVEEDVMPRLSKFRIVHCSPAVIRIPNRIRDIMVNT